MKGFQKHVLIDFEFSAVENVSPVVAHHLWLPTCPVDIRCHCAPVNGDWTGKRHAPVSQEYAVVVQ